MWKFGHTLALFGGIIIVGLSLAAMINYPVDLPIRSPMAGYFSLGVISLLLGIVAIFGSKRIDELVWGVGLMIIGFLSGGIGGLLTLIGGLVGLLSRYVQWTSELVSLRSLLSFHFSKTKGNCGNISKGCQNQIAVRSKICVKPT